MAVNLSPVGGVAAQFFTNTGAVLTGGKLYTYAAGTTTPAVTYTSSNGATAQPNPIVLDAAGRVPNSGEIWLTDGISYKFILRDSNDVLIATYDNITGINSNAVSFTNQQQIVVATAGQTVFNLSISYQVATNSLSVFVDGVNQYGPGAQYAYTETSSTSVTFTNGLHVGAVVKFTTTQQQGAGAVNASQVTYNPAGTGAVATNVQAKLRQTVSVADFGAVGDGTTDDTTAIQNAITYCKTLVCPSLIIGQGTFLISSTLVFDLPNYSTMEFIGSIVTAGGQPAIRIGSASANRFGYRVTGIKVSRTTVDTAGTSVGVQLRNIVWSYIDIRSVTNFKDGVYVFADQSNGGVSYNEIHLGQLHDNRTNLLIQANGTASGYVNENLFFGGSFNHSSGYPAVTTTNIFLDYDGVYRNNNNRFYSPSLEDNSALAVAAVINGDNNIIFHPRLERITSQSTYQIQFTANSRECQLISNGFTIANTNISDLGDTNSYSTRDGQTYKAQTAASAGQAVYSGQSTATSSAKIYSAKDSGSVEKFYVLGTGDVVSSTKGYFESGTRWSTASGSLNDRGLFNGTGSPEGVLTAAPGSLYCNNSGGAGTTLYVKETGSGNTGWAAK